MAFDYQETLSRIIGKAKIVAERYAVMQKSRAEADARIAELEAAMAEKDKELERLRMQVEYLQMAKTIAPSRDQIEGARAMISSLVREIDRCIVELND